jgi:DNA-binding Lrp family transcriptional regulator
MLNEKEKHILQCLRKNGRCSVTKLAKQLQCSRNTVLQKLNKLENSNMFHKHTCLLNFNNIGYPIHAKVLFKLDNPNDNFAEELVKNKNTNNVLKLGNRYDILVSFVFRKMEHFHTYMDYLNNNFSIKESKIYYITDELKREGFY